MGSQGSQRIVAFGPVNRSLLGAANYLEAPRVGET